MTSKRMPWDRPIGASASNRQGDYSAEPIFMALGRALSTWEGVNAAINSLHFALHVHLDEADRDKAKLAFSNAKKTDDRAQSVRQAVAAFLDADFGENRAEAAKLKKLLKSAIARYNGWVARRNELAHGYVTEAQSPNYSLDEQPIVTVYALLPSHARSDRW